MVGESLRARATVEKLQTIHAVIGITTTGTILQQANHIPDSIAQDLDLERDTLRGTEHTSALHICIHTTTPR